jgi:hypothetical protein
VPQAIDGCGDKQTVRRKHLIELREMQIKGQYRTGPLESLGNELLEILLRRRPQSLRPKSEVAVSVASGDASMYSLDACNASVLLAAITQSENSRSWSSQNRTIPDTCQPLEVILEHCYSCDTD